jgi:hypothetical protein
MQSEKTVWRPQLSLTGLFAGVTWICLTTCTFATNELVPGRFLAGAIFVLACIAAVILVAASARLRRPALVFLIVTGGHIALALRARELYPLLDVSYDLVHWLELPNTPHGLGEYVMKALLAISILIGLIASLITHALAPPMRDEKNANADG